MRAGPCKIVENTLEDSRTQEKIMEDEAAQAKSEGQHIHGVFHTRLVHTSCKWDGGVTLRWHTHLSPDHSIWEDYAKMKPAMQNCRKHTGGLEDSRTQEKIMEDEAAQAKSEGQHIHGVFHARQVHTSCKWGGGVTLRWHTHTHTHLSPDHSIWEDYAK